ncbi:MAG: amino acid adenylation domain-containing protein, partial [Oscillochloris sp.]|nr:amino acid adenylation domain-containing protein [Oscillochloris sp.]
MATDRVEVARAVEVPPETVKEDNNAVLLGLIANYPRSKYTLTYSLAEPSIYFHVLESDFGLKGKRLTDRILAELKNTRDFQPAPDAVGSIRTDDGNLLCIVREDGLSLIAQRGRLMQSLPSGGVMATVFADVDTVRERLQIFNQPLLAAEASGRMVAEETDDVLAVAAINGPKSTVVSGRAEAVAALLAALATDGIETRPMATSHAFHSPLMEPILDAFGQTASNIVYAAPHIPLVSNLNGKLLGPGEVQDASYWRRHIREAVQFYAGMQALRDAGCTVFLEIGPQPHLTGMGRYCLPDATLAWLPSLKAGQDDWTILLDSLARLYVRGVSIDWASFDQPYARQRTEVPTYPFQRERYWIEVDPRDARPSRPRGPALHPLLGRRVVSPLPIAQFESRVSSAMFPDYQPNRKMTVPEETFIDLAQAAAIAKFGPGTRSAVELALHTPLILNGEAHTLQTLLTPVEPGAARVEFFSQPDSEESWALHAAAVVTYVVLDDLPAEIVEVMAAPTTAAPASYSWTELIALPQQDRQFALAGVLRAGLAAVLRIAEERISLEHTLSGLGLDSIMAIELKAAIERSLSITIPIAALLTGPSLLELAGTLLAQAEATSAAPQCTAMGGPQVPTFPLSYGQRAMWFQHQVAPASIFNPVYAARLRSPLDLDAIRAAFQTVVARHSSLRTTFSLRDGVPMQVVADEVTLSLRHEEALGLAAAESEARLNAFAQEPFDLEHGPLFRVYVLSIGPEEHLLAMASHHLVTDLWSQAIIVHEVAQLYALPERAATLPQPGLHLADYVRWQHDLLAGPTGEQLWDYWRQQLAGELPVLHLPTARLRPPLQTYSGDRRSRALGTDLTGRLRALSEHAGTTLYATLLAAFHALLFRYTGQSDIIVGTATNGRSQASMADVVGYFVNSLPVRANVVPDQPFSALLAQVKQTVVDAISHQDYPLALLVERLRPARDLSRTPLFQVMFVFQRAHLMNDEGLSSFAISGSPGQLSMGPLRLESVGLETQGSPFDMTLMMVEAEHGLQAEITFNTDLFDGGAIERMLSHLEIMLASVVANPEQPVGRLALMPASELDRVVRQFNATNAALPINQPIHVLFEAHVDRTPAAIAVVDHSATWPHAAGTAVSYRELDLRANQLAHYLRARGVGPDVPVAICLERSLDLVVAILGVLKAGGAYIPVDPAYPADRISFMLADAQPAVLLTTMALQTSLNETLNRAGQDGVLEQTPTVVLDAEWSLIANAPATRPQSLADAHNLAYIIYTSGSTGRPKGVMIEHRGLCNLVLAQIAGFGVTAASRVLQFASFSFDASVSEIFMALACGARLVLAGRETLLSSTALPQLMRDEAISVVTLPPSLLSILVPEELPGLRTLISAGETLPVELARRWSLGRRMFNAYGPTETTIGPTFFDTAELDPAATTVPIGRPIANTQIYILDAFQQPVPLGVLGEISVGGVGLARVYLKRPELSAERFVEIGDWAAAPDGRPTRLYRTGDLGRFRADGSIEYLGRADHQVKIRGLRIELGEIESQLRSHPALREAYVIAREDTP